MQKNIKNLSTFGSDVFTWLAETWKVEVKVGTSKVVDCCEEDTCGDTRQEVSVVMTRPGVNPVTVPTFWEVGFNATPQITPIWMLNEIASRLTLVGPQRPEDEMAEIREFITNREGLEPRLWVEHMAAFALADAAIECFIAHELPEVTAHN